MRRLKLFTLCAALVSALAAGAQELVTDAATELVDGTVIALQCRDYNGGATYYFNGAKPKSPSLSSTNLYVVDGTPEGFKLRRLTDNIYIGRNGTTSALAEVTDEANAATFTAKNYGTEGFGNYNTSTSEMSMLEENRKLYVRFSLSDTDLFLNTGAKAANPQYTNGLGSYSVWYVFKYPEIAETVTQTGMSLTFDRTGTDAASVTVTTTDLAGTANSVSTTFKEPSNYGLQPTKNDVNSSLLVPNKNINTKPTIQLRFILNGLPEDFSFNKVLLDLYPVDLNGNVQSKKSRKFNFALSCGTDETSTSPWVTFADLDLCNVDDNAADSKTGKRHQWWTIEGTPVTTNANGCIVLDITVTQGSTTDGCFFGLGGVKFVKEEESITSEMLCATLAKDIEGLLSSISEKNKDIPFPTPEEDAVSVVWPGEYKDGRFKGLDGNYFNLLKYAEEASEASNDEAALTTAKENMIAFVTLSNQYGYPRSFVYTVGAAEYTTAFLPVKATLPAGLELYVCTGLEGNTIMLEKNDGGFENSTAYIVKKTADTSVGQKYQFIGYGNHKTTQQNSSSLLKGTHDGITLTAGDENNYYVLQNQNDVLGFYLVDSDAITVPAGKCYLQLPAEVQSVKCLLFPDGTVTAIDAVDAAAPAADTTYDLSGRRVTTTTRGLYIVGGRKVLVK